MQCIEVLSRALPRILAVSNAMPPNAPQTESVSQKKTYRAPLELEQLYIARVPKKLASASFEAMPWFQKAHRKYISIKKPALPKSS